MFIPFFLAILLFFQLNLTQSFNYNEILIKKPYETVCEETTTTQKPDLIDQLSDQCPLEYKSSSLKTGCLCNLNTTTLDCLYSNRLNKIPDFFNVNSKNEWNINLKCKNFTHLTNLEPFLPLETINILDLSSHLNPHEKCKIYPNENLVKIVKIGSKNHHSNLNKSKSLKINELNLELNNLNSIHLIKNNTNYQLNIKTLRLSNNFLEFLDIKTELDLCYIGLENLNVSNNRLKRIEIGYFVFLQRLNLSNNYLSSFIIDFYNTKDFQIYYSKNCKLENSTSLHSNLIDLDLSHNFLPSLPFNFLNIKYLSLLNLNLSSNQIREIRNYEFSSMTLLERLDLSSNLITNVANKSFYSLKKLKYIDLANNYLTQIPKNLFHDQKESLEYLNLNHNNLTQVAKEAFKYLGHVKYMHLSQNKIEILKNYSFGFMFNLIELYLAQNEINTIELNAFYIDEQSYYGPGLVEKLDLSFNKLTYLDKSIFSYLTNLRYLILNNNKLERVDTSVFQGVNYLITLDLRLNYLKSLDFLLSRNFSSLRNLKLSNNLIEFLRPGQFSFLKSLNYLDLSGNRLKYINSCAFYGIQNTIKKLFLNYNLISRLNTCAFTLAFKNLRFVQIMHNPLNCTNNCEFFFTVYNPPYSINYQGVECVNNTLSSDRECSQKHYDKIFSRCKLEAQTNDCSTLANDLSNTFQNDAYFEYDYVNMERSLSEHFETNWGIKANFNIIITVFVLFINIIIFKI
ncbi:unnamed protein product [Brachionus calyciflorus]|uniref:Uncharacterized protein n=1 Tax=Brachionus calyciflorus TaxID=104777 RepID=A0A813UJE6_9BILA|nr:unnamed protein product [Brachionus calyciflorus]